LGIFCGTIENNVWYKFVASATTATFTVGGVTSCTNGVQTAILSTSGTPCTPGSTFTVRTGSVTTTPPGYTNTVACANPNSADQSNITATGLTVGTTYYIMIDGQAGAQCGFTLTATAGVTSAPAAPNANFSASPTTICAGQSTTFSYTGTGSPLTYYWEFSGGSPATSCATSPSVTYATAGTYEVKLTVRNYAGTDVETKTSYITVTAPPTASITAIGPFCSSVSTAQALSATPAGGTFSGPGVSGTTFTPSAAGAGTHTITYSGTSGGCSFSTTRTITVNGLPGAPSVSPVTRCSPGAATLTASGGGGSYRWYDASSGGTLLHTGANYTTPSLSTTTTYYVSSFNNTTGCESATRTAVTVTIGNTAGSTTTWTGASSDGPNDWFDAGNWSPGCVPTCGVNVIIPGAPTNEPSIDGTTAATQDIDLQANSSLSFTTNGKLTVCGDFYHYGALATNDKGTVEFASSTPRTYYRENGTGNFNNVIINNTGGSLSVVSSLGQNLVINETGTLTFMSGVIITTGSVSVINVRNNATGAIIGYGSNTYVQGRLRRFISATGGSYDFPVGTSGKGYQLININFYSGTSDVTNLTASFTDNVPSGSIVTANECGGSNYLGWLNNGWWTVTSAPAVTTAPYHVTAYNNNYTPQGTIWTVCKRPSAAGAWALNGNCVAGTPASATQRRNLVGFSDFVTQFGDVPPLPVTLTDFTGKLAPEGVRLSWTTSEEAENAGWDIERSDDLTAFGRIGWQPGAGSSNGLLSYGHLDASVVPGKTYFYRLRQVDYNGTATYSNVVEVQIPSGSGPEALFGAYPNPTSSSITLSGPGVLSAPATYKLYDMGGKLLLSGTIDPQNPTTLSMAALAEGLYHLQIQGPGLMPQTLKVVKVN